ncbi:MAG: RDD family protein [Nostocales cyanobacterium]|nr:MAG: RDD family protein [Nostocales cyanobacterium]TAF17008.1 MAG: RDD family protein [Nostocales cyanobacterium]
MHLFNKIKFSTPESVELEFTLAGIGSRALGLLIDYHVLGLTIALFIFVWVTISSQIIDLGLDTFGSSFALWMTAIAFVILFCIYTGYFVFFETLWQGQTPGKRFAKIRVIRDDGRPVGLQQASLRALLRPIDEFLFIGAFLIMLTKSEKRLGDLLAGTIVIQAQKTHEKNSFTISQEAKSFYISLQKISDLSQLLPDDFAIIREYLQCRNGMSNKARSSLSIKLAEQVKSIINLNILPADISADVLLEAVYLAYQKSED